MNRYSNTSITTRFDGKRVYKTTRYPIIPVAVDDIYVIANDTDYLDTMANKFYRDPTLWWIIAQANGIKATLKAPSGMQMRIPRNIDYIIANFRKENSL